MKRQVALRLEGGVGDHILGSRIVSHVRSRYPDHSISVYSDCGGFRSQLQVCGLMRHVSDIIPVYQNRDIVTARNAGSLSNLHVSSIEQMKAADVFFDTWPGPVYQPLSETIDCGEMFIPHAKTLGVSNLAILATRPDLIVPQEELQQARSFLQTLGEYRFIMLNLEKRGRFDAEAYTTFLRDEMLTLLAEDPTICILNIYSTNLHFPHYPDGYDSNRRRLSLEAASSLESFCALHPRIVPVEDVSIIQVAALLTLCKYLIGVDNGIKHLGWALGVPLKFLTTGRPLRDVILRWMPDPENLCVVAEQEHGSSMLFNSIKEVLRAS